jgi:hypothetical protein
VEAFTAASGGRKILVQSLDSGRASWPPGSPLASLLDAGQQRWPRLGAERRYPGPGEVLTREGDAGRVGYLLLPGTVQVSGAIDEGEALLATRAGDEVAGCGAATRFSRVLLDPVARYGQPTPVDRVIARPLVQTEFATLADTAESTRPAHVAAAQGRLHRRGRLSRDDDPGRRGASQARFPYAVLTDKQIVPMTE